MGLATSISSDHKTKNPMGIIPKWACHLLPQENHPNSFQHTWNLRQWWEFYIYSSISVCFIRQLRRSWSSFALWARSAIFVLWPENHQHAAVGLRCPSGACGSAAKGGQGGGRRSKDGHGHGKGGGEKSLERIHASPYFSILSQLAMCLQKLCLLPKFSFQTESGRKKAPEHVSLIEEQGVSSDKLWPPAAFS